MILRMSISNRDFDAVVIAGDIGGTNTNLALVASKTSGSGYS